MSKYEDPTQLDYRYGGDTVDDFAQKYMKTVAYIFSALNELRSPTGGTLTQNPEAYQLKVDDNKLYIRNQANTDWILLGDVQENFGFRTSASDAFMHESDVADSGTAGKLIRADASGKLNADILGNAAKIADKAIQMGLDLADEDRLVYDKDTDTITNRPLQFKVDGDKIYARKDATTGWVLLGDLKQNLGFRSSTDDAFLTESDVADNGTACKLVRADVNGKLNADILGNARKMAGKTFAPEDLQDGQIPVYRASDGTWHAENKGTVGTGKNLMIMDGDKMLGEYNGDEMKAIDIQKSSLTKALAESTGYGIVSGCEPSINGLTVTVSAGVIHTADGHRVEVPEQSIMLDAADATKPRMDVVYLDKYGKIAKLTGELGTPAVAGSNTYTISTNFAAGDTVTFGGVVFTCTASTQDATNFALGADTATSATNLAAALNTNSSINAIYTASTSGSVVTITEKSAGGGNTPGAMMTSGTGVVTAGSAVSSTTAFSTAPGLMEAVIKVGEIAIKVGAVAGAITASYNHYKTATITYHNVSMMRQDRTLMPGMVAHTLGYYAPNDGGGAVYIIRQKKESDTDNGGSCIFLDTNNVAELIIEGAVNVKQFGAKGDGVTDDTDSIQSALNTLHDVVIPKGTYVIRKSLYVTGRYRDIYADSAYINYTGSEFALVIEGVVSSTYHLGVIWSDTGNAIKFTASYKKQKQGKHYCQYMTIYFKEIWAKTYDIKFDIDVNPDYPADFTKNGWLNEIRFYNGRLASTSSPNEISYGVYADSKGQNYIICNKFYNVGLESPRCGIYLANKCNAWAFSNCHWWDTNNMLTTEGECNGIVIETSEYLGNLNGKFNLSAHTNGRITCMDTTSMATQHIINNGNIIFKDGINIIKQALVDKYNQDSYGSEKGFLAFFRHHVPDGHTTWYLTVPSFIGENSGIYLYLDIYKNSYDDTYGGVIRGHYRNNIKKLLTWFVSTGEIQSAD
jgi:hypothetical protein